MTTDIIHQWKQPLNRLMLLISNLEDSILSGEEDEVTVLELSGEAKEIRQAAFGYHHGIPQCAGTRRLQQLLQSGGSRAVRAEYLRHENPGK